MRILLIGYTSALTGKLLEKYFPQDEVYLIGEFNEDKKKILRHFVHVENPMDEEKLERVIGLFSPERVIFLSWFAEYQSNRVGELDILRWVMKIMMKKEARSSFLYVAGPYGNMRPFNDRTMQAIACENLLRFYALKENRSIKILRSYFIYSAADKNAFLNKALTDRMEGNTVLIPERSDQNAYFVDIADVMELIHRVLNHWDEKFEYLNMTGTHNIKFQDIIGNAKGKKSSPQVLFASDHSNYIIDATDNLVEERYGWNAERPIQELLKNQKENSIQTEQLSQKKRKFSLKHLQEFRMSIGITVPLIMILSFFIEVIQQQLLDSSQYAVIDLRILLIIVFSIVYGMREGLITAVIECGCLGWRYYNRQIVSDMLLHNVRNWIPFGVYLVTALLCSYSVEKAQSLYKQTRYRNSVIKKEYENLKQSFQIVKRDNLIYKRQILNSHNGFSKMYQIIMNLHEAEDIDQFYKLLLSYVEKYSCLRSVSIYEFQTTTKRCKMIIKSMYMKERIDSLNLEKIFETTKAASKDVVWINTDMTKDAPMYTGVFHIYDSDTADGMLILIYGDEYLQLSLGVKNMLMMIGSVAAMERPSFDLW